ncbi:MAG: hypothetical protein AAF587_44675, partial [Bacteroidota bacterium]
QCYSLSLRLTTTENTWFSSVQQQSTGVDNEYFEVQYFGKLDLIVKVKCSVVVLTRKPEYKYSTLKKFFRNPLNICKKRDVT